MSAASRAHGAVASAIRRGDQRVIAHHDDYERPLDVRWLCRTHHFRFHLTRGDYENLGSKSREAWARRKAAEEVAS